MTSEKSTSEINRTEPKTDATARILGTALLGMVVVGGLVAFVVGLAYSAASGAKKGWTDEHEEKPEEPVRVKGKAHIKAVEQAEGDELDAEPEPEPEGGQPSGTPAPVEK